MHSLVNMGPCWKLMGTGTERLLAAHFTRGKYFTCIFNRHVLGQENLGLRSLFKQNSASSTVGLLGAYSLQASPYYM